VGNPERLSGGAPEPLKAMQQERAAELSDDAAPRAFACEIVRELAQSSPTLIALRCRDETRPMVLSIPFLASCA